MRFEDVRAIVGNVPLMPPADGRIIYEFIVATGVKNILELGFAHGTSTCYMAAALDEAGSGHITTIDNVSARKRVPDISWLLERTRLARYVTPMFSETSYTWEIKKLLEEVPRPQFEFCFIDGAHSWETDGFAFFLLEKLLAPGGWILFDDIDWTYAKSPGLRDAEFVKRLPDDVRNTPHIGRVVSLLVEEHPSFENVRREEGRWAWAQKRSSEANDSSRTLERIYADQPILPEVVRLAKRVVGRIRH